MAAVKTLLPMVFGGRQTANEAVSSAYSTEQSDGYDAQNVIFRQTAGRLYMKVQATGYYREVTLDVVLGQVVFAISTTDLTYNDIAE